MEKNLKAEQQRIRKFVKEFMTSAELKREQASPEKISKTGNVILDRINNQVERQRTMKRLASVEEENNNKLPAVKEDEQFFYSLNEKLEKEQKLRLRSEIVEESSKQQSPASNQEAVDAGETGEAGDAGDSTIFGGIL